MRFRSVPLKQELDRVPGVEASSLIKTLLRPHNHSGAGPSNTGLKTPLGARKRPQRWPHQEPSQTFPA